LLTDELRKRLPQLYSQEARRSRWCTRNSFCPVPLTWYVIEGSPQGEEFLSYGFVVGIESEFGLFPAFRTRKKFAASWDFGLERDLAFREGRLTDVVPAPDV